MQPRHPMPRMLFIRDYQGYNGGHRKVFDYISHVAAMGQFLPALYCTKASVPIPSHYLPHDLEILKDISVSDAYFVAGNDWVQLDNAGIDTTASPVINLIQGLRHANPDSTQYRFLDRPALRICVSDVVADAIRSTDRVNGPICVNYNGIAPLSRFIPSSRTCDVFIAGAKNPDLARRVAALAQERGISLDLLTDFIDQRKFLRRMASAKIALTLPLPIDGFFLPGLEAMALGCIAVVPDCPGARSYCIDGKTGFTPTADENAILTTIQAILADAERASKIRNEAKRIVQEHSISRERKMFSKFLSEHFKRFL